MGIKIGAAFVEVSADTSKADKDIKGFKRNVNGSEATLNVNADSGLASKKIAFVARTRFVDLNLRVNGLSVAAAALTKLSGASVLGKGLKGVGDSLNALPNAVPKIAGVSMAIGALSSVAISSVGSLLSLGGSLASVAGAGLALPGILAGAAVGGGILIAALKDAPTVLADLGSQFTGLQKSISTSFWNQAAAPIRSLVTTLLPQVSDGIQSVASEMGGFFGEFAGKLQSSLGGGVLNSMLGNLSSGVTVLRGAIGPVVDLFTTLGLTGSQYLPGLSQGIVDVATKFNAFIQGASADGRLKGWIDTGIAGLKSLGDIVGSVSSILYGLYSAATAAGGSSLQTLAAGLGQVAEIVNSPAFQGSLVTIFKGAAEGASGLFSALGPIGNMFQALAPAISYTLSQLGQLAGLVLGQLASALSNPAIASGLMSAVAGIATGVQAILPSLPALAQAFGAVMSVVGQLASVIGPVLGVAISTLAPILSQLLPLLEPIITMLGQSLVQAIASAAPIVSLLGDMIAQLMPVVASLVPPIMQIVTAALPPLFALMQALAPVVVALVAAIAPLVAQLASALMPVFAQLTPLMAPISSMLLMLVPIFSQLVAAVIPLIAPLMQLVMAVFPPLMQMLQAIVPVFGTLVAAIMPIVSVLADMLIPIINALLPVVQTVFQGMADVVSNAMTMIQGVIQVVTGIITGNWDMVWTGLQGIVSGAWQYMSDLISNYINVIGSVISAGWSIVTTVIGAALNMISGLVSGIWNNVVGFISGAVGRIGSFISSGFNSAVGFVRDAFNNISNAVQTGIGNAVNFVAGLPGRILGALGNLGGLLVNAGNQILQGFLSGLKSGFEAVQNFVGGIGQWIADHKGPKAYDLKLLVPAGGWIMEGLGTGLDKSMPALGRKLSDISGTIADSIGGDIGIRAIGSGASTVSTPSGYGSDLGNVAARGMSAGSTTNTTNVFHVTIDAKNVDDFNKVVNVFDNLGQAARTGRGTTQTRIV